MFLEALVRSLACGVAEIEAKGALMWRAQRCAGLQLRRPRHKRESKGRRCDNSEDSDDMVWLGGIRVQEAKRVLVFYDDSCSFATARTALQELMIAGNAVCARPYLQMSHVASLSIQQFLLRGASQ